ncbi:hypothetical protein ASE01_03255 [Nocardioides sp. Root190]|uniref:hypothetical protein n=1 Tax=Nocardioides sp. Root190 TaxID=1736488 RepID=UPI0006FFE3B1|nr:hypothetical protein [Nocardioides sp. Root190]KRB80490.1 hypothetical protein ASE01_03255 [Nocardioides sp. Root190]
MSTNRSQSTTMRGNADRAMCAALVMPQRPFAGTEHGIEHGAKRIVLGSHDSLLLASLEPPLT